MKIAAADIAHGPQIDPTSVLAHLRAGEWEQVDEHRLYGRHVITLFEHQRRPDVEVHVPVWQEARDYPRILAEALNTIASAEGISVLALLSDLRLARADVLRVDAGEGPLTLPFATAALGAIRMLYATATQGLTYGLRAIGGSPSASMGALLERITLELGAPDRRVVRAFVPVAAEPAGLMSHAAERGPLPIGRASSEAVATMLDTVGRASRGRSVKRSAELLSEQGVEPPLCHALASIGAPLRFEISWALGMPRPPAASVTLSRAQLIRLAEAAERLPPRS